MLMFFPFYVVKESGWRLAVCRRVSKISILFAVRLLEKGVPICCPFLTPLHHDLLPVDSHCLSPFALSPWSLECQETILCPQGPAGPSLYKVCPGGPKLSLTICLHLGCSLLPGQLLPHFSTFCDKLNCLSLEESSLATPSHPQEERDLPQSVSPTAVSRLQVRSFRAVSSRSSCLPLPLDFCILSS